MTTDAGSYLSDLHQRLSRHFNLEEIRTLCLDLNVDYESVPGVEKPSMIRELLLGLGRNGRLPELITLVRTHRPRTQWPAVPDDFELPAPLVAAGMDVPASQLHVYGDVVQGDKISAGDISGSYNAIGSGARVIVNHIQEAYSAIAELEEEIQVAERRLAEAIQKKLGRYTDLADINVDERDNPYKALLDYRLEDAPFFFGRTQATNAMLEKINQNRMTILHSDSGSGKTSLLQAGLASRLLAEGHFPLYLRPYRQTPDKFIKKTFLPDYATQPELSRFSDDQMSLRGFLERVTHYLGDRRLYIFLDQFEEFFTELQPEQQQRFAGQLQECVESDLPIRWILALRKEYFSDLRLFRALKPYENEYFLPTFNLEEAQEVITEPATLKGVAYEEGVVDRILDDIRQGEEGIQPAQVQLVCDTLFSELKTEKNTDTITAALYDRPRGQNKAKGAEGILTSHLSRVLNRELKGSERKLAGRVLEALVTSDLRRVVRDKDSLIAELDTAQPDLLDNVLDVLYDNRLVRREVDDDDQHVYELTHDYLLSEIEIDPETQARKAAQELLAQEVEAYQQFGTLLSKDRFDIINSQKEYLKLGEIANELLGKSEAALEAERLQELERQRALAAEARARQQAEAKARQEAESRASEQARAAIDLRRRLYVAGGALVIAVLALVAAVYFGVDAERQRGVAETRAVEAEQARGTAVAESNRALAAEELAETRAAEAEVERTNAVIEKERADTEAENARIAGESAEARLLVVRGQSLYEENPLLGLRLVMEGYEGVPENDDAALAEVENVLQEIASAGRLQKWGGDIGEIKSFVEGVYFLNSTQGRDRIWFDMLPNQMITVSGEIIATAGSEHSIFYIYEENITEDGEATGEFRLLENPNQPIRLQNEIDCWYISPEANMIALDYTAPDLPDELRFLDDPLSPIKLVNGNDLAFYWDDDFYDCDQYSRYLVDANLLILDTLPKAEVRDLDDPTQSFSLLYAIDDETNIALMPEAELLVIDYEFSTEIRHLNNLSQPIKFTHAVTTDVKYLPRSDFLLVHYDGYSGELRYLQNITQTLTLSGELDGLLSSGEIPANPGVFILDYRDRPGELRYIGDTIQPVTLTDRIEQWHYIPEGNLLVLDYGAKPGELRFLDDPDSKITLTAGIRNSYYFTETGYLLFHYYDHNSELRHIDTPDQAITLFAGYYDNDTHFFPSQNLLVFNVFDFAEWIFLDDVSTKLLRENFIVEQYFPEINIFTTLDPGPPCGTDLRFLDKPEEIIANIPNPSCEVTFTYFSESNLLLKRNLWYPSKDVLYPLNNITNPITLAGNIYSSQFFTQTNHLLLDYSDAIDELIPLDDPTNAIQLSGNLAETMWWSSNPTLLDSGEKLWMITYDNGTTELWHVSRKKLLDLGLGVSSYLFDEKRNWLNVWYEDGSASLVDVAWLLSMAEDNLLTTPRINQSIVDEQFVDKLMETACNHPFNNGIFDASFVIEYLPKGEEGDPVETQVCR